VVSRADYVDALSEGVGYIMVELLCGKPEVDKGALAADKGECRGVI
jgi:hypothetical protein